MEDRFIATELMIAVSGELEAAGFKHVVACHHIDPEWRAKYRPLRPELEPVAWTVSITDFLLPLPKIKALIDICEKHNFVVWWDSRDLGEDGRALYLKIGTNERTATAYITPN